MEAVCVKDKQCIKHKRQIPIAYVRLFSLHMSRINCAGGMQKFMTWAIVSISNYLVRIVQGIRLHLCANSIISQNHYAL
jgi:hypothetical protein